MNGVIILQKCFFLEDNLSRGCLSADWYCRLRQTSTGQRSLLHCKLASSKSQWHALCTLKRCRYTNANTEFLQLHYGWDEHRIQRQMLKISGKKLKMRCAYILYMFWQSRGILCQKVPQFFCWQFICLPWEKKGRQGQHSNLKSLKPSCFCTAQHSLIWRWDQNHYYHY